MAPTSPMLSALGVPETGVARSSSCAPARWPGTSGTRKTSRAYTVRSPKSYWKKTS